MAAPAVDSTKAVMAERAAQLKASQDAALAKAMQAVSLDHQPMAVDQKDTKSASALATASPASAAASSASAAAAPPAATSNNSSYQKLKAKFEKARAVFQQQQTVLRRTEAELDAVKRKGYHLSYTRESLEEAQKHISNQIYAKKFGASEKAKLAVVRTIVKLKGDQASAVEDIKSALENWRFISVRLEALKLAHAHVKDLKEAVQKESATQAANKAAAQAEKDAVAVISGRKRSRRDEMRAAAMPAAAKEAYNAAMKAELDRKQSELKQSSASTSAADSDEEEGDGSASASAAAAAVFDDEAEEEGKAD